VQLLELVVAGVSAHGSGVTLASDPAGWLVKLKSMVPEGALFVPLAVSVTVTTQLAGLFAGVDDGQSSTVDVPRAVTVIASVPVLPLCGEPGAGL
jgi:hypothetical protein